MIYIFSNLKVYVNVYPILFGSNFFFVLYNSIFQTICCSDENPCESFNKTCEYTCDPTEQKCLCPIGYQLAEDGESCIGNNQYNTCKR